MLIPVVILTKDLSVGCKLYMSTVLICTALYVPPSCESTPCWNSTTFDFPSRELTIRNEDESAFTAFIPPTPPLSPTDF